jgi:hypothetical protein
MQQFTTMKMLQHIRITTAALAIMMVCSLGGWAQSKIYGTVKKGLDVMPYEKVQLWRDGQPTTKGTMTDEKGKYEFSMLEPGNYTVKVVTVDMTVAQDVVVATDEYKPLEFQMAMAGGDDDGPGIGIGPICIYDSKREVFTVEPKQMTTYTYEDIQNGGPGRGIEDFVSMTPGFVQKDAGDPLNFKGGRPDANATYIDGMKLRGSDEMPMGAIAQISVVTGGLPAEYGDVMGAVIVVTTRNPGMTMGHVGKPLTKAEKQQLRQLRKKGSQEGSLLLNGADLACACD